MFSFVQFSPMDKNTNNQNRDHQFSLIFLSPCSKCIYFEDFKRKAHSDERKYFEIALDINRKSFELIELHNFLFNNL